MASAFRQLGPKPPRLAENPYATHIPVLVGLTRLIRVQRALEYGCGQHSTLAFLNQQVFPDLEELQSYENDGQWYKEITELTKHDPRARLEFIDGPIAEFAEKNPIADYDVVLVDDSITPEERIGTIRHVTSKLHGNTVVLIHDFEHSFYREAATGPFHRFSFDAFRPHTGVVWTDAALTVQALRSLNRTIRRHQARIRPEDIGSWARALNED
jgi:hypothetical protein